jgi:hypothetical protein
VVLSVAPVIRWSGTDLPDGWTQVTRIRAGGVVRVEVARPWLVSGEGEQLAVVLGDDSCTALRRDPIWPTPPPPATVTADLFAGNAPAAQHPLPEQAGAVTVVPYDVSLVDGGEVPGHAYADVELPQVADSSYSAFVSLGVARYQPSSVEGAHLSRVVRAEPAQLLPTRTLTVTRTDADVTVTLAGFQPDAPETAAGSFTPVRTRVDVNLEALPTQAGRPDLTSASADVGVGWQRVSTATVGIGEEATVSLPADGRPLRLVVREVEQLAPLNQGADAAHELADRVPFIDVVPLR